MNGGAEYVDVDEVLAILGNPGPFQIIQFIFLSSVYLPLSINDYVVIFFGIAPLYVSCSSAPGDHNLYHPANSTSVANVTSFNITPWNSEDRTCSCPSGFEYVYPGRQWSIIGDMDLVCDKSPLVNLATVIYFLGWVIASPISGWATDHFGRRPTLFVSYGVYTVSQIGLIFSRDYISFTLLRFTVGSARQILNTAFFVLMMEWIPPNKRVLWGTFSENQYNMGLLLTALIGFLLQNWIHIQIFIAVFCVTAVPLFWLTPESLTWLHVKNRGEDFVRNCRFVAKFNRIELSDDNWIRIKRFSQAHAGTTTSNGKVYTFIDCFRTPLIRETLVLNLLCWFASSFGLFGTSYLSSAIATDVYLDLAIEGLLALIPTFLATYLSAKWGNRLPLTCYFFVGGIFAIIAGVIPASTTSQLAAANVMSFFSRMAYVATFCVTSIYTTELFPTVIRSSAFCLCFTALSIGCMVTPLLPLMVERVAFKGSGFLFVGLVSLLATLAAWLLRETKGLSLPETIEEVEQLRPRKRHWPGLPFTLRRRNPISLQPARLEASVTKAQY